MPPQLKQISAQYKVIFGCECCIYDKSIHASLLSWRDRYLEELKYQIQNSQNRRSYEKENSVMPHRRHIYDKASDMAQATMCVYPMYDYAMPHWKCVLRCCADCPCMYLPDQETYYQYLDTTHSIRFHIYHIISRCNAHGRIPLIYRKTCYICKQEYS